MNEIKLRGFQTKMINILKKTTPESLLDKNWLGMHVITGAGKGSLGLIAGHILIKLGLIDKIVIVTPRDALRLQAAQECDSLLFKNLLCHNIRICEAVNTEPLDRGTNGYATTYQTLLYAFDMGEDNPHLKYFRKYRCLLVLDECHHVAVGSKYDMVTKILADLATYVLYITGTVERDDGQRIAIRRPGAGVEDVEYISDEESATEVPNMDIEYKLRKAIRDEVVIRTEFIFSDAKCVYRDTKGKIVTRESLGDDRAATHAALETEFGKELLCKGIDHWGKWKEEHENSKALIICYDQDHAEQINDLLRSMNVNSGLAISKYGKDALDVITDYKNGVYDCLVTVYMGYEGLNVPPISHIICLTAVRSKPWLEQMFGRGMRVCRKSGDWIDQWCYVFVPDDDAMHRVVDAFRNEQVLGWQDRERINDLNKSTNRQFSKGNRGNTEAIHSETTRVRVCNQEAGHSVSYELTKIAYTHMDKHNLTAKMSLSDFLEMCKHVNTVSGLILPEVMKQEPVQEVQETAGQRFERLKREIEGMTRELDDADGFEHGPKGWNGILSKRNKDLYSKNHKSIPRDKLSLEQLEENWEYVKNEFDERGLDFNNALKRMS